MLINVTRYFTNKQALSKETAIEVTAVDWIAMGFIGYYKHTMYKFIKEDNGKFWLDEDELIAFNKRETMRPFWVGVAMILVTAVALAIVLSISL